MPVVQYRLFTSNVLRFVALRALGARVAFSANMSSDVDLLDPSLLVVGPGATLGARTLLSGHFIDQGELATEVLVSPKGRAYSTAQRQASLGLDGRPPARSS